MSPKLYSVFQTWKLCKPVVVKDLKAVDVQHADDRVLAMKQWVVVLHLDNAVDAAHDPAEEALVESLQETGER